MAKISIGVIEELQKMLSSAPAKSRQEKLVSKAEAVRLLRIAIKELRERGYALEEIAELLRAGGFEIGSRTLQSYIATKKRKSQSRAVKQMRTPQHRNSLTTNAKREPAHKGATTFKIQPDRTEI